MKLVYRTKHVRCLQPHERLCRDWLYEGSSSDTARLL
jgi:hypothetical protein